MGIDSAIDAENVTRRWLINKFGKDLRRFRIIRVWKDMDLYFVDCVTDVRRGLFGSEIRNLSLQIDSQSEDILGYK